MSEYDGEIRIITIIDGVYRNLTFASAEVDAAGLVTVRFSITSDADVRLAALEQSQAEQDEVIAELIGGEL